MSSDGTRSRTSFERYRDYLDFFARLQVDPRFQGKIDLSGVVQQTLLEAHLARDQVRDEPSEKLRLWLRRILSHNLGDEIRKLKSGKRDVRRERSLQRAIEHSSARLEALIDAGTTSPDARLVKQERAVQLVEALNRLPPAQREALVLQHWQEWSLDEIAQHMDRTPAAVAGLIKRGLSRLRVEMRGLRES
jgi:RNA polymerase sigma-70 factor (ECF subfamily)